MNSVRIASLVATFAFGLMGCATEGLGQAQTAGTTARTASYDLSTSYQPSPNARLAAPATAIGSVEGGSANGAQASYIPSNFYNPDPNARPAVAAAPATVIGSTSGVHSSGCADLQASAEEGMPGVSPNVRACP